MHYYNEQSPATIKREWKPDPRKSYANRENAVKAAEDFVTENEKAFRNANINPKFVVIALENGRFSPMFFHTGSFPVWFAHAGFCVTN